MIKFIIILFKDLKIIYFILLLPFNSDLFKNPFLSASKDSKYLWIGIFLWLRKIAKAYIIPD
jgi:hypothetical protein